MIYPAYAVESTNAFSDLEFPNNVAGTESIAIACSTKSIQWSQLHRQVIYLILRGAIELFVQGLDQDQRALDT